MIVALTLYNKDDADLCQC